MSRRDNPTPDEAYGVVAMSTREPCYPDLQVDAYRGLDGQWRVHVQGRRDFRMSFDDAVAMRDALAEAIREVEEAEPTEVSRCPAF